MLNGFNFDDTLVNPRQRVQVHQQAGQWDGFGSPEATGAISPADLADRLEAAAAQLRALARPSRPINLRVYIDTLIVVTDPRALAGLAGGGFFRDHDEIVQ
jgi:hypothetical protein